MNDLERIAREAVKDFFERFADEIEDGGIDYVKRMFGDKGPGSFDDVYFFGGSTNGRTDFNNFFCNENGIELEKLVAIMNADPDELSRKDAYLLNCYTKIYYEDTTEIAEKYATAIVILYDKLYMDIESVGNDLEHDYLTENTGRSGRNIIWYLDETKEAAIYTDSYEFLTKKQIEKELM